MVHLDFLEACRGIENSNFDYTVESDAYLILTVMTEEIPNGSVLLHSVSMLGKSIHFHYLRLPLQSHFKNYFHLEQYKQRLKIPGKVLKSSAYYSDC